MLRFGAYRCQRGYEVAKEREREATTSEEKEKWNKIAQKWMSRWKEATL